MSDLVKRLKTKRTPVYHGNFQDGHWEDDKDCQEAAAEIERLTTALSAAEERNRNLEGKLDALLNEEAHSRSW